MEPQKRWGICSRLICTPRDDPGGPRAEERRRAGVTGVGPALLDPTLDLWCRDLRKQGPALSDPTESTDSSQSVSKNDRGRLHRFCSLLFFATVCQRSEPLTTHTNRGMRFKKTSTFVVKCFYFVLKLTDFTSHITFKITFSTCFLVNMK